MSEQVRRLSVLHITQPCSEAWESMSGDDQRRHCARCDRDVHDVSSLSVAEVESLVLGAQSGEVCLQVTVRDDGEVITRPQKSRSSAARLALMVAGVSMVAACSSPLAAQDGSTVEQRQPLRRWRGGAPLNGCDFDFGCTPPPTPTVDEDSAAQAAPNQKASTEKRKRSKKSRANQAR